jgi:hypothetical protein
MIAGAVSGALAKTSTAPLSRLTILYQVGCLYVEALVRRWSCMNLGLLLILMMQVRALSPSSPGSCQTPSLVSAMRQVVQQEGVLSLWKGNLATIIHRGMVFCGLHRPQASIAVHVNEQHWIDR